jgi:hypothetical protein
VPNAAAFTQQQQQQQQQHTPKPGRHLCLYLQQPTGLTPEIQVQLYGDSRLIIYGCKGSVPLLLSVNALARVLRCTQHSRCLLTILICRCLCLSINCHRCFGTTPEEPLFPLTVTTSRDDPTAKPAATRRSPSLGQGELAILRTERSEI